MASRDEYTEPRGYIPATSDPEPIMETARNRDLVIECTGASGVTHSFIYTGVDTLWACQRGDMDTSFIADPERDQAIENCIRRCDPDVRLVEESLSVFGNGNDD